MVQIVGTPQHHGDDSTFSLTNGSQAGRAVLVVAAQSRSPTNLENFEFNGVPGTVASIQTTSGGGYRTLISYWEDADLPATSGTYAVDRNTSIAGGTEVAVFELSGAPDLSTMEVIDGSLASGHTSPIPLQFQETATPSIIIAGLQQPSASGGMASDGLQEVYGDINTSLAYKVDDPATGSAAFDSNGSSAAAYSSIQVLESGPQVSTTGTLRPDVTIAYTPNNFTSSIIDAAFTDSNGNAISLTVNSQSELQASPLSDGANYAAFGTGTLEITDGTDTATTSVDFSAPSGWTQDVLQAGFGTTEEFWTNYAATPATGQQFFWNPSQNGETVEYLPDGGWSATGDGTYTLWAVDPTDGILEKTETIAGELPSNAQSSIAKTLSKKPLTARSVKASGITIK